MYFTLTSNPSSPTTISLTPLLSSSSSFSNQNPIFNFPSSAPKRHPHARSHIRRFSIKSSHKPHQNPLQLQPIFASITTLSVEKQRKNPVSYHENNVLKSIAKTIVYTLFCIVIGLLPVCCGFRLKPAIAAAPVVSEVMRKGTSREKEVLLKQKDHEYSGFTRRLLEVVAGLVRSIEEARTGNGELKAVEVALREVKSKKRELQEEIMSGLYAELGELKSEKEELVKKAEDTLEAVLKAKREEESLLRKDGEKAKERIAKLEEEMHGGEEEYNRIWEKVGEIEDTILRRETVALSIGVRELCFIERESEVLVEKFRREMRWKGNER